MLSISITVNEGTGDAETTSSFDVERVFIFAGATSEDGVSIEISMNGTTWNELRAVRGVESFSTVEPFAFVRAVRLSGSGQCCLVMQGEPLASAPRSPSELVLCAGHDTEESTPVVFAVREIDISKFSSVGRVIKFSAWLETSNSDATANLELYNLTDLSTVHTFTSTSTSGELKTATIADGILPESSKTYSLRLWRTGGSFADLVGYKSSFLEISFQ